VKVLGADLPRESAGAVPVEPTVVLLGADGRVTRVQQVSSLPALAEAVVRFAAGEPFLLGVNVPVVVPAPPVRARAVEGLLRRRLGFRLPKGGRAGGVAEVKGGAGEPLLAGLAAAGQPCLPYPDRDRRQSGLAETYPPLILKALLWESSLFAAGPDPTVRELLFRAGQPPAYRAARARRRSHWTERAGALELLVRALGTPPGFDLRPAGEALARATTDQAVERAAGLLDALLIAGTARRYLEAPESCLFLGDREQGYVILPADGLVRRLSLGGTGRAGGRLFPRTSLSEQLGAHARLRPVGLLAVPGQPQRTEARFDEPPHYEFDNLDEMLWWKHCRHVAGPGLPTEGLEELVVVVGPEREDQPPLRLLRSRHRTLSFRFEPPVAWRSRVPTRDGKTYPFRVLRAVYAIRAAAD